MGNSLITSYIGHNRPLSEQEEDVKLATYLVDGRASYGAVEGEAVIDIPALLPDAPVDVQAVIAAGSDAVDRVRAAVAAAPAAARRPLAGLTVLPPIPNPPKVFCIGRNYAEHAKEAGLEMSPLPIMFNRFSNTLIGDGADVLYPKVSEQLDWEGELAVVIGKGKKGQIAVEEAMDHVFGYTAFNDITVRNYQFRTTQYIAGKNADPGERRRDAARPHLVDAFRHSLHHQPPV
jgi:2-keto-4-pentenoate hydratase/2-oxohepta-3-ene-1,7-dioic acid hydratase in catechol pathway